MLYQKIWTEISLQWLDPNLLSSFAETKISLLGEGEGGNR